MIVTCERCSTQFQLDDARIPEDGVRVRCSRCKHAFQIHKKAPVPASGASEDEESDWQFNEDPPRGGAGARGAAASVVDDLLGGGSGDAGDDGELFGESSATSGLELRDASGAEEQASPPKNEGEDGRPAAKRPSAAPHRDASPVAMPDGSASGLELEGDPVSIARKPAPAAPAEDPVADLASELAVELTVDAPSLAAEPASPAPPASEQLSPADWDFLADSDPAAGAARSGRLRIDPDELIGERPRWLAGLDRAGRTVGWLAVAALFAFGLHGGLRVQPDVSLGPPVASRASGAELREVTGRFVDHAREGTVYVVSGRVANTGSRPIQAGTLALEVQDGEGRPLAPRAPVAAPLSSEAMREGRLHGPWRQSPALRPGESRAFQAVLGPLPAAAQQLSLTIVPASLPEAAPGSQASPPADGPAGAVPPPAAPAG